eukprot:jgi/Bigna1/82088/fgenesh1_pg.87_\
MCGSAFKIQSHIRRNGTGWWVFRSRGWLFPSSLHHIPVHRWGRPPENWMPNEGFSDLHPMFTPDESRQDEGVLLKLCALQAMSPLGRGCCGWREASVRKSRGCCGHCEARCPNGLGTKSASSSIFMPSIEGNVSAKAGDVVVGMKQTMKDLGMRDPEVGTENNETRNGGVAAMPLFIPFGFTRQSSPKLVRGTAFRTLQVSCCILEVWFAHGSRFPSCVHGALGKLANKPTFAAPSTLMNGMTDVVCPSNFKPVVVPCGGVTTRPGSSLWSLTRAATPLVLLSRNVCHQRPILEQAMSSREKLCLALGASSGVPSTDKEIDRAFRRAIVLLDDFAAVRQSIFSPSQCSQLFLRGSVLSGFDHWFQLQPGHIPTVPKNDRLFTWPQLIMSASSNGLSAGFCKRLSGCLPCGSDACRFDQRFVHCSSFIASLHARVTLRQKQEGSCLAGWKKARQGAKQKNRQKDPNEDNFTSGSCCPVQTHWSQKDNGNVMTSNTDMSEGCIVDPFEVTVCNTSATQRCDASEAEH